jgi:hypothetical protein
MKMKKQYIYILVIAAVVVGFLVWKRKRNQNKEAALIRTEVEPETQTETPGYMGSVDQNRILGMGSRGQEVRVLQGILNDKGESIAIDGIFGKNTLNALQKHFGVSEITLNKLYTVSA